MISMFLKSPVQAEGANASEIIPRDKYKLAYYIPVIFGTSMALSEG